MRPHRDPAQIMAVGREAVVIVPKVGLSPTDKLSDAGRSAHNSDHHEAGVVVDRFFQTVRAGKGEAGFGLYVENAGDVTVFGRADFRAQLRGHPGGKAVGAHSTEPPSQLRWCQWVSHETTILSKIRRVAP